MVNMDDLKNDLAVTKAIDFIKSHANIVRRLLRPRRLPTLSNWRPQL